MTNTTTALAATEAARDLARIDRMANLLDARFRLFGIRFGLDGILGLVPGLGDAVTLGPSAYMLYLGVKHGVPRPVLIRMAGNAALDFVVGGVPLLGDVFDVWFKSHLRNAELLRKALT